MGYPTDDEIQRTKNAAFDPQRHVGDRIEALCDLYELYKFDDGDPQSSVKCDDAVDRIREIARQEI